nr:reverse transcriptase domain-containing protein [Tanacetum cinerariifolium]
MSGRQEISSDSKRKDGLKDTCEDLNSPYKRPKPTPFTQRITRFKYHKKVKLPRNIRVYKGNKEPEDHFGIFSAAVEQEEWLMPVCFEELSQKFLEEFSQQKRYAKDPTEIHGIKRRQNEGLQTFMDWFKSESSHIKGVPSVLRISAFMHCHGHPELAKKPNDNIPKTVDELFKRVKAFIRGEVAIGSAEMVRPSQWDNGYIHPAWTGGPKKARNRGGSREAQRNIEVYTPYPQKDTLTPLIKTPNEILAMENVSFPEPLPLIGTPKKQNLNKFCDYHGNTNDCYQNGSQGKNSAKVINMIREGENHKRYFEEGRSGLTDEPTFPMIPQNQLMDEPIVLEGIIKGRTEMRSLRAIGSTIHSMIKFPTNQGIVAMETISEALWECRQLERMQDSRKEVQWRQRKEQMSRIREQVILRTKSSSGRRPNSGPVLQDNKDIEEVCIISHERPNRHIMMGTTLTTDCKQLLIKVLRENIEVFAWAGSERTVVPRFVMKHQLKIYPFAEPVIHKRQPITPNGRLRMMKEVLADQKGQNMEIYLEEIVIKSKRELDLVQDVKETLRKLKRVNIKIDPVTSPFRVKEGRFLDFMVTQEGVRADLEKVQPIILNPTPKSPNQIRSKETIEKGLSVGIILVNPKEKMYSYVIRLKFNASNHAMDCEALLTGLAVSVSKGMKDLHVFMDSPKLVTQTEGNHISATKQERKYKKEIMDVIAPFYRFRITHFPKILNSKVEVLTGLTTIKLEFLNQEVSVGIKTRPSVEETSSSKKGKATRNVPSAKPNYNWEASGSN